MGVVVGVDSHKQTLAAAAVDNLGAVLDLQEFPNTSEGHGCFRQWLRSDVEVVGIECSGSFGAALAASLHDVEVKEVPAALAHREAQRQRSQGKSDAIDAVAIARVVARDHHSLPAPRHDPVSEELHLLTERRDQQVRLRTQLLNRIHKDLVVARPGYGIKAMGSAKALKAVVMMLRGDHSMRAALIRDRVADVRQLNTKIERLERQIEARAEVSSPALLAIPGVGSSIAARIVGEVGDVRRIRSRAAFAKLAGVAPIPASSGATDRFRLNRSGNRQLNLAIHQMAVVQLRVEPKARLFYERKRAEGKSYKEAMRCLKRHLANVVYSALLRDSSPRLAAA